jgi:hypothetical protein
MLAVVRVEVASVWRGNRPRPILATGYDADVAWDVRLLAEVEDWVLGLDDDTYDQVAAAIDVLADRGPALGRPLVDRIEGSKVHNLKELRPGSTGGSEVRVLFVFDPDRRAVLLVAGDKASNWSGWYATNILVAERRYDEWLRGERDD